MMWGYHIAKIQHHGFRVHLQFFVARRGLFGLVFLSSADFPLDLIMPPRTAFLPLSLFEACTPIGLANPALFIHCKYLNGGPEGR